jgi:hypothetical protein
VLAKHSANLHVQLRWLDRLCERGRARCVRQHIQRRRLHSHLLHGVRLLVPVSVPGHGGGNRTDPLFEHVFPPLLAPSLSIGIPIMVFAPWFFEAQTMWVAQVLYDLSLFETTVLTN